MMLVIFELFLGIALGTGVVAILLGTYNLFKGEQRTRTSKSEADILDNLFTQVDKKCNDIEAIDAYNRKRNELRKKSFPNLPPISFNSNRKIDKVELGLVPIERKIDPPLLDGNIYRDFVPKNSEEFIDHYEKKKTKRTISGGPR